MTNAFTPAQEQVLYCEILHRVIAGLRELTADIDAADPDDLSYRKSIPEIYEIAWKFGHNFAALDWLMSNHELHICPHCGNNIIEAWHRCSFDDSVVAHGGHPAHSREQLDGSHELAVPRKGHPK